MQIFTKPFSLVCDSCLLRITATLPTSDKTWANIGFATKAITICCNPATCIVQTSECPSSRGSLAARRFPCFLNHLPLCKHCRTQKEIFTGSTTSIRTMTISRFKGGPPNGPSSTWLTPSRIAVRNRSIQQEQQHPLPLIRSWIDHNGPRGGSDFAVIARACSGLQVESRHVMIQKRLAAGTARDRRMVKEIKETWWLIDGYWQAIL